MDCSLFLLLSSEFCSSLNFFGGWGGGGEDTWITSVTNEFKSNLREILSLKLKNQLMVTNFAMETTLPDIRELMLMYVRF